MCLLCVCACVRTCVYGDLLAIVYSICTSATEQALTEVHSLFVHVCQGDEGAGGFCPLPGAIVALLRRLACHGEARVASVRHQVPVNVGG